MEEKKLDKDINVPSKIGNSNLSDDVIVKSLECCSNGCRDKSCFGAEMVGITECTNILAKNALDLIHRLQSENAELQKQVDELENKIEQGTLIELPCKYGELLFKVCSDRDSFGEVYRHIEACRVDEIMIFRSGGFVVGVREINTGYGHNGTLGDTLFFTFEEAEKRLKELQE
jgi:hypothetical protein